MQINGTLPLLAIHLSRGRQQAKTAKPEILDFTLPASLQSAVGDRQA